MRHWIIGLVVGLLVLGALPASAAPLTVYVLDSSRTMNERWEGETKWNRLVTYVASLLRNTALDQQVAVITFGSDRCEPTLLAAAGGVGLSLGTIESKLATLGPGGDRGLVGGLDAAVKMGNESGATLVRLLVFTSGVDQCNEDLADLSTQLGQSTVPRELQIFGLDMTADQALDLTEGAGRLGGTFRPFEDSTQFQNTLETTGSAVRPGLSILVNTPADETGSGTAEARLEVYAAGNRTALWQQSVQGSATISLPPGTYDVMVRWSGESRWNRGVSVTGLQPTVLQFDFAQGVARVQVNLGDSLGTPMPGELRVVNASSGEEVAVMRGDSAFALSLAPGTYRLEVRVGSTTNEQEIDVEEGDNLVVPIYIEGDLGQALISINNFDQFPVNGDVLIYEQESGALVESYAATSSVRARLAPGTYEVVVRVGANEDSQIIQVLEGDEVEVPFEMEVPLGGLFVELVNGRGLPVYGLIQLFDTQGNEVKYYEVPDAEDTQFSFNLPVGVYSLRVESDGIVKSLGGISIRENEETSTVITFAETQPQFGDEDD